MVRDPPDGPGEHSHVGAAVPGETKEGSSYKVGRDDNSGGQIQLPSRSLLATPWLRDRPRWRAIAGSGPTKPSMNSQESGIKYGVPRIRSDGKLVLCPPYQDVQFRFSVS